MSSWYETFQEFVRSARLAPQIDEFYFLRHGETDSNRNNIIQGWLDVPLNETGLSQAETAARRMAALPITHTVASPLQRARRTAEIVVAAGGYDPLSFESDIRERSFGPLEGQAAPATGVWKINEGGVETLEQFAHRVVQGLNRHLLRGTPLIVAHGGIRRVLMAAFDIPHAEQHYANAVPMQFLRQKSGWSLNLL